MNISRCTGLEAGGLMVRTVSNRDSRYSRQCCCSTPQSSLHMNQPPGASVRSITRPAKRQPCMEFKWSSIFRPIVGAITSAKTTSARLPFSALTISSTVAFLPKSPWMKVWSFRGSIRTESTPITRLELEEGWVRSTATSDQPPGKEPKSRTTVSFLRKENLSSSCRRVRAAG